MGLAASQGRLLALTARNHDLVYEGQQISQARLALAEKTQLAAEKYTEAMNNKVMEGIVNGQAQRLTYDVLTSQDPFSGLCMRLVDTNGNVVVPGESIEIHETKTNEETQEISENISGRFTSSADFIKAYMSDLPADKQVELSVYSLNDITEYYNTAYENKKEGISAVYQNKSSNNLVREGEQVLIDSNLNDPDYIQQMLMAGVFLIQQAQPDGSYEDIVWQGSSVIQQRYYTEDDAAAEAEYEASMIELQREDKILELRLDQVETEQKAVSKEAEDVKQVIKDNIEGSFKSMA